jgi:hypothetical protein
VQVLLSVQASVQALGLLSVQALALLSVLASVLLSVLLSVQALRLQHTPTN